MQTTKTIQSWNKRTSKDCFGNGNPTTVDHIWPTASDGAAAKDNTLTLSKASNEEKANKTSGKINGIRFSITKKSIKNGKIYGRMVIQKQKGGEWYLVVPINTRRGY